MPVVVYNPFGGPGFTAPFSGTAGDTGIIEQPGTFLGILPAGVLLHYTDEDGINFSHLEFPAMAIWDIKGQGDGFFFKIWFQPLGTVRQGLVVASVVDLLNDPIQDLDKLRNLLRVILTDAG